MQKRCRHPHRDLSLLAASKHYALAKLRFVADPLVR